jgi:hypothetical protein
MVIDVRLHILFDARAGRLHAGGQAPARAR